MDTLDRLRANEAVLVSALSKIFPSYLAKDDNSPIWELDWTTVVFIQFPTGQASWHVHDKDLAKFCHLPWCTNRWDGHTTEEKYERLDALLDMRHKHGNGLWDDVEETPE